MVRLPDNQAGPRRRSNPHTPAPMHLEKIGLALSGGGFRAAAFHLGVLKRLREIGLLDRVAVLSTVSGGSIVGAFWAQWRATAEGDPQSADFWDRFEQSAIAFMRLGLRGRLLLCGFALPAAWLLTIAAAASPWFDDFRPGFQSGVALGVTIVYLALYYAWQHDRRRRELRPEAAGWADTLQAATWIIFLFGLWRAGLQMASWFGYTLPEPIEARYGAIIAALALGLLPIADILTDYDRRYVVQTYALHLSKWQWYTWKTLILRLGLPFFALLCAVEVWTQRPASPLAFIGVSLAAAIAYAYFLWHYVASPLLEWFYERHLFRGMTMAAVRPDVVGRPGIPFLVVNGSSYNFGQALLFTPRDLPIVKGAGGGAQAEFPKTAHRAKPEARMPSSTRLATAVAVSSAFPGVFSPLNVHGPVPGAEELGPFGGETVRFRAGDGGVVDNQGVDSLLRESCSHLIVSDGAASLKFRESPWSTQVLPFGEGVMWRTQDIIYERVRERGYQLLATRAALSRTIRLLARALRDRGSVRDVVLDRYQRSIEKPIRGYVYVELIPSPHLAWAPQAPRLPKPLQRFVAGIRTDLDRFTPLEIATLMYHGYTLIDNALRVYRPTWLTATPAQAFRSVVRDIDDIQWTGLEPKQVADRARYLDASDSRSTIARAVRRLRNRIIPDEHWLID